MNYVDILIPFVGGLGMFIYGMQIMAQGLENAAGSKMKSLLEVLTKNKLMGVLLGAAITAVIQSSSATTVMVVGFVNAGIMNLTQAMGVIMGANVGNCMVFHHSHPVAHFQSTQTVCYYNDCFAFA